MGGLVSGWMGGWVGRSVGRAEVQERGTYGEQEIHVIVFSKYLHSFVYLFVHSVIRSSRFVL